MISLLSLAVCQEKYFPPTWKWLCWTQIFFHLTILGSDQLSEMRIYKYLKKSQVGFVSEVDMLRVSQGTQAASEISSRN